MYQQNQSNPNFRNQNAGNVQNMPQGHQQNDRQFQSPMFPVGNFEIRCGSQISLQNGNQIPGNQLPPLVNSVARATNNLYRENVFNQSSAPRVEQLNNNMTLSVAGPSASTSYNHGTNFQRFESTPQSNVFAQSASLAASIPQNNEKFSTQYKVEANANRSSAAQLPTRSVVSNVVTTRSTTEDTMKKNGNEKIRIFTGTAEKIIKWHKIYNDYFCFYELIASIVSIEEGTVRLQKRLLLRDKKGPIIQVIHYVNDHINIENFAMGQMLRCVGHMVGTNILHGLSIREATPDEVATVRRMCYIGDHAIAKAVAKS